MSATDLRLRTVSGVSPDRKNQDDRQPPGALGPVDLAKAVFSWIIAAIATLVVVWLLVFAATRGDIIGLVLVAGVAVVLVAVALFRRRGS